MAAPPEKLAQSLEILRKLRTAEGAGAIRAKDLSRTHRERLVANGFLQEVIKGWYVPSRPDEVKGESTAWYASFWRFCAAYLKERFATRWCLSPEQSLSLHAGNWTVPRQLVVRSPGAGNKVTKLPYDTSLLELRIAMPAAPDQEGKDGLRLFTVESALIECSPNYFSNNSTDVRAVLPMIRDASGLLARLLEGSHTVIAGRLAGAFRNIGRDRLADDIVKTMSAADYDVRETDPFTDKPSLVFRTRETSPYVNRIRLLWQKMREPVIDRFPKEPGIPRNIETYMKRVNDAYVTDAYHSLSIEAEKRRQGSAWRECWPGCGRGSRDLVPRTVRAERRRRPAGTRRPCRLPQRPGLYPEIHACAAEPRGGEGRHAGVLRSAAQRDPPSSARCARAFLVRLHPSLYGRQR